MAGESHLGDDAKPPTGILPRWNDPGRIALMSETSSNHLYSYERGSCFYANTSPAPTSFYLKAVRHLLITSL
jgi:hypothetical protein